MKLIRLPGPLFMRVIALMLLMAFVPACSRFNSAERHYKNGFNYFQNQKFKEASLEFRNALQRDPRAWRTHYYLAMSEAKLGLWSDAYKDLSAVVEAQPKFAPAKLDLADLLLATGNTDAAEKEIDEVQAFDARNARAEALRTAIYIAHMDFGHAVQECEKAKELAPQEATVWTECGFARLGAKQYPEAEADFQRALVLKPDSPEQYRNLANLLRLRGRMDEVESLLRRSVQTHPNSLELTLQLADFYFQQGRLDNVEQVFTELKSGKSEFLDLAVQLGDFWIWRNQAARAVKELETEQARRPTVLVQKKLVSAYLSLGRVSDARQLNGAILKKDPRDLEGRAFAGAIAYLQNDFRGATEKLQEVLKDDPRSLLAEYYLGLSWAAVGQPERAKTALSACVRLNENFVQAYTKLAELNLRSHDWQSASEYATKAIAADSGSPEGYLLLAQAKMLSGRLEEAAKVLDRIQKLRTVPPEFNEVAAQFYTLKGDETNASKQYAQALVRTTQPFNVVARYAIFQAEHGRPAGAIRSVQQWMETVPPQPAYYELLANFYLKNHDFGNAELTCRKALALDPQLWSSHLLLGAALQERADTSGALAEYDKAINANSRRNPAYLLAGNLLMNVGHYDNASAYLEAALREEPDSLAAQTSMARWYADQGQNLDVALSMAQQVKKSLPDDRSVSDTLGWIYFQKHIYGLALQQLQIAAGGDDNALVQYHIGMTYLAVGETSKGRHALQRAIKLGLQSPSLAVEAEQHLKTLGSG